ncbi:hypothetical protein [uncultured Croceitalea sp.]|uniref:hypothetical protein n=1 Tax=uncultured Croceitalea sp. TaxID=1798908 RepID=UPI0033068EF7
MKLIHIYRFIYLSILVVAISSCSSSSSGDDTPTPPPTPMATPSPSAATLVFPEDDTECNTGAVVSDSQSNVTFEWNASQNTDSYEVNLLNLETNASSVTTVTTNEATILIDRGAPYEWFVVSKASGTNETAMSLRFRFYNEGLGVENYAPFPAEAINPARGSSISATSTINLEWNASDVDNDILEYEVLFDTNANPTASIGIATATNLDDVTVSSGNTYYWVVITRDEIGNSSTSEVFQFRVL